MKTILILGAVFGLLMASACTVQMGLSTAAKGRVMVAASMAQKGVAQRIPKPARVAGARSVGVATRSRPVARARDLSAATDIASMSYSITDMGPTGSGSAGGGQLNPSNPSIDLTLTPSENYRVSVDVVLTSVAPGASVGVTHYGDQADFAVDPNYDTYVELTIQPTSTVVFDPASVTSGSPSTINAYNPASTRNLFTGALTVSPADRLFMGPDARLYYFNKNANTVFWWPDISKTMAASNVLLTGTSLSTLTSLTSLQILAVCADSTAADVLWLVASDSNLHYYYFEVTMVSSTPSVVDQNEITGDLTASTTSTTDIGPYNTVVVTGMAVDSTYHDVYISYASTDVSTNLVSGVLEYYFDSLEPYSLQNAFADSTSSIYTDVAWNQGKLWALLSANTGFGPGAFQAEGTSDLQAFDDFMTPLTASNGTVSQVWSKTPAVTTSGASLGLPNRFTGPIQGSVLYLDQMDFMAAGMEKLTSVNLDTGVLTFY